MEDSHSEVYERLINAALRFVSFRMRSSREIRTFLAGKLSRSHTTAPEVLEQVMGRLTELGYVNDHEFAVWWVGTRMGRKPKGPRAVRSELTQKGVDGDIINTVLTTLMTGDTSEVVLARAAADKKAPVLAGYPKIVQKQKLIGFLQRRGFSSEVVWSVVDDVVGNV